MNVVVLVPRRADGGRRDQIWEYVRSRWTAEHPAWRIVEGHHDEGLFNRSAAINAAAADAGDFDVAIIADSDSFVSAAQIDAAVARAVETGQMTLAYDRFTYLTHDMSNAVMAGFDGNWWTGSEWSMTGTCSSMVVVTRKLWDQVGGFDEGFVGWGAEDVGFSLAAQTFGSGLQRVPGDVWHLWHVTADRDSSNPWAERLERYKPVAYDKPKMRALLKKLRAEVAA
jgi:hypothetical protein